MFVRINNLPPSEHCNLLCSRNQVYYESAAALVLQCYTEIKTKLNKVKVRNNRPRVDVFAH